MARYNTGRVAYVEQGIYSPFMVYNEKDVVFYNNGSYVYTGEVSSAGKLPTDTAYWSPLLNPSAMNSATAGANQAAILAEAAAARANAAGFNLRGNYSPDADPLYAKHDMVYFNGGSYAYTNDTSSNELPTSTTHWQQIASQGLKGDPFEYEDFTSEQLEGLVGNGIRSILRTSGDGTPGTTDIYTITYTDTTTDTFTVYNGTNGVTTASQLPIVDAGEYFTTHNVEAALQEVGGVIKDSSADDGQVLTSDGIGGVAWETPVGGLVARLAMTGQDEIVISAIDYNTSTFTSVGHTLSNGDKLVSFMNHNVLEAILQYLPAGMNITANPTKGYYFVVNADQFNGTFQISLTLGGAPIALSLRGTENFSKWHFEKVNSLITGISGLNGQRFRVVMTGQFSGNLNTYWGGLNMNNDLNLRTPASFLGGGGSGGCWAFIFADYIFDSRYRPSVCGSMRVRHQFDTTAPATLVNRSAVEVDILTASPQNFTITSIGFFTDVTNTGLYFANGSIMEVYAC